MDLFEYQARDLFESYGVPVLKGAVATTPEEARSAAASMGGRVVVKAQVKVGGRGKAGGVKLAESADDAFEKARAILGMDIKGHTVHKVMIAQAAPIESEYYLAILVDRAARSFLVMA
ncbi:MAG: acetate--CoA ligase family protein, partial [Actinomycetales bacterium]|nr:acetate--CoA ligase family protein [Actinomycetales bacterium]